MVLATFVWGSGHPVGKLILADITPAQLSMVSSLLSALSVSVALILTKRTGQLVEIRGRGLILTLLSGVVMFFIYPNLSFSALQRIPASANSVLVATSTIFAALLGFLFLKEKLTAGGCAGIFLAFVGVALVVFSVEQGSGGLTSLSSLGVSLAIFAAITSATYGIIGRKLMATYDALCVTFLGSVLGGALQTATVYSTSGFGELFHASTLSYVLIAYWGLFSGLGYVLFYYSLVKLEVAKATVFFYLSPLFAVALSIMFLGEEPTLPFVIGIGAILFGIWATQSGRLESIRSLRR